MKDLPTSYQLWLPDNNRGLPITGDIPAPGTVFPDTDNPLVMILPFHRDARFLAKASGIEENALFSRMASIMQKIEPFQTWSSDAEKHLQDILKCAGPGFPYNRLRAVVARKALFHVAAELADCGRLSEGNLKLFFRDAMQYDPAFLLETGITRPPEISIPVERKHPKTNEEWKAEANPSECISSLHKMLVLAEDTHFRNFGDDRSQERRQSLVLPASSIDELDTQVNLHKRLHQVVIGLTQVEYSQQQEVPIDIIIANRFNWSDSPGSNWLAVNPAMAMQFGWQYVPEKWFRWHDASGQIMVKSLWWQDGLLNHISRVLHCTAGEGWLVLAAKVAVREIQKEVGKLLRVSCVTRSAGHGDTGETSMKIDEVPTP